MIQASLHGRLGGDPEQRETKTGTAMTTVSVAVACGRPDSPEITEWVSLIGFGKMAETLKRHCKGEMVSAMGEFQKSLFTGKSGEERSSWSLRVDAIISARIARPPGGRKRKPEPEPEPADDPAEAGQPFDDPVPGW